MSEKAFNAIIFLGVFVFVWLTFLTGWSEGWRAHDKTCPPNISEVILQKEK